MEILIGRGGEKTKPIQSQSAVIGRESEGADGQIVNPEVLWKGYLKKQSQFAGAPN